MGDIQRAITIEREYILHRLSNEEPYSLADKVAECGFDSLDGYFSAKLDYLVASLNFVVCDRASDEGAQMTIDAAANDIPLVVFCKATATSVYHGDEEFNRNYCEENDISILDYHSSGGNIVISDGDMAIGLSIPVKEVSSNYILEHFAGMLSKYTDDVSVDNNDILVGGVKVAGSANYNVGTGLGFVIHFSFSDKTELIRNICIIDSQKQPGYLQGMTVEQLRQEVIEWLQKS